MDSAAETFTKLTARLNYPIYVVTTAVGEQREGCVMGFATVDKFSRCEWREGPAGVPILGGCPNWFVGTIVSRHDLGDHEGYLLDPIAARCEPAELLYFHDVKDIEPGHSA